MTLLVFAADRIIASSFVAARLSDILGHGSASADTVAIVPPATAAISLQVRTGKLPIEVQDSGDQAVAVHNLQRESFLPFVAKALSTHCAAGSES
jgi:hypothetical protein